MSLPTKLTDLQLSGSDFKRQFDKNYLEIVDRLHPDLPLRYKIDFIQKAALTGADPRLNQIHLTSYYSKKLGHKVGVVVFSYHFFLNQANQTGEYEGVDLNTELDDVFDPIKGENKEMLVCTATVHRKDKKSVTYKARWSEVFNSKNDMWIQKPYTMLEKTAIANALRWAFPEALSGMFIEEEMKDIGAEAEKIAEREGDIEAAATRVEKQNERVEQAKESKQKEPKIKVITELAVTITNGMNADQKVEWLKNNIGTTSFDKLKNKKVEELNQIVAALEKIKSEPIVMPDDCDIPY